MKQLQSCCTIEVDEQPNLYQHTTRDIEMNCTTVSNDSPALPPEIMLIPNNSLLTETPEEGRQLAVKINGASDYQTDSAR
ncbi:hypothetical protein [Microcoleus vaginatus]|uniref:hypothetical protein n=1 Tax=Microcoleus vaginatus TaxID=119532 RepID=UPI00020D10BD|nr:hypothetical protein MicvaDRAFT_1783 [Microcoleus vaginatus FGP-2]